MKCKDCGSYKGYRCVRWGMKMDENNFCHDYIPETGRVKVMLDKGAIMPTRAHELDAGLDLYTPEAFFIETGSYHVLLDQDFIEVGFATIDTGVHIAIPEGYVGMIKSKSGLNVKHGLIAEGVIDSGYTGSIVVKLYNMSGKDYRFNRGEKIAQLVIMPIITPELKLVDKFDETERGNGGFGSTGK